MNKILRYKLGYTIAELILVIIIIGMIASVVIASAKPYEKALKKAYSRAYDALTIAAYNYSVELEGSTIPDADSLCVGLTKYLNSFAATSPKAGEGYNGNPNKGFCNNISSRVTQNTSSFNTLTPDFVTNNGMRFFISSKITTPELTDSDNLKNTIEFFIVFVDLDGERGAGTLLSSSDSTNSDVVAFAINQDADLIPLGIPVINKSYLTARVSYPEDEEHPTERFSKSLTYYDAKYRAWGGATTFEDLRTFNYNSFLNSSSPIISSLSYPTAPNKDSDCEEFDCDVKIQRYF